MNSPQRILIAEPLDFSPKATDLLKKAGEVVLQQCDEETFIKGFKEYDVVWFRLRHRITRNHLKGPLRCRIIATPVTGIDHIDLQACAERGIQVISLRGETAFLQTVRATAELTIALTLSLLRRIPQASISVLHGNWKRDMFRGRELFGKTVGIVGMGRLGTLVAKYFKAFGMEVLGYDPRPDFPEEAAFRISHLSKLLRKSDIVSLHVPYDHSTRHLIGPPELKLIKTGAILVNTSRGGIIDENALLDSLSNGHLAGAALDVLDGEPSITQNHPLISYARKNPNVLILPHIGGNTLESFEKTEIFLAHRVRDALFKEETH